MTRLIESNNQQRKQESRRREDARTESSQSNVETGEQIMVNYYIGWGRVTRKCWRTREQLLKMQMKDLLGKRTVRRMNSIFRDRQWIVKDSNSSKEHAVTQNTKKHGARYTNRETNTHIDEVNIKRNESTILHDPDNIQNNSATYSHVYARRKYGH